MKKYPKEPFEELSDEQLDELLTEMNYEIPKDSQEKIKQTVFENINKETEKIKPLKPKKKKWVVILGAVAVLSLMVGYTQLDMIKAAYTKVFGTEADKILIDAEKLDYSVEDQGLKLTAKNTFKDGNTTYVFLELQDLTGDRLSEDTIIEDWSMLNGGNTQVINYDKKTKTATLLVSSTAWEEHKDTGFMLKRFVSYIKEMRNTVSVDWERDLAKNVVWQKREENSGFGRGLDEKAATKLDLTLEELSKEFLPQKRLSIPLMPNDDIFIENMAYKDGLLHILVKWPETVNYNYVFLALQSKSDSTTIDNIASYSAYDKLIPQTIDENSPVRSGYDEFVFDIKESDLKNYDLKVEVKKAQAIVSGNWAIKLKEPKEIDRKYLGNITLDKKNITLSNISISSLSLNFDTKSINEKQTLQELPLDIKLYKRDGEILNLMETESFVNIIDDSSNVSLKFDYTELSDIELVIINGQTLKVN